MFRYLRLFAYFVRFSLSKAMEFRLDFWFRIVMDLLFYAVNIAFYEILFLHFPEIGGWTREQTMIFVAGYLFIDALNMTLFSNNLWGISYLVNRGDLDYYLLRPVSTLFFVSLRDFAANSFVNLLMTFGILGWAFSQLPGGVQPGSVLLYLVLLVNGTFIFYLLQILFTLPIFWTHSIEGIRDVAWSLSKIGERPDRILTGWVRRLFTIFLPYALTASFPARLALEPFDWGIFAHLMGVTVLLACAVFSLWKFALRSYSSASS